EMANYAPTVVLVDEHNSPIPGSATSVGLLAARTDREDARPRARAPLPPPAYAQGGVAAALEEDVDSPDLHFADTLTAGAHLCDEDAVRVLVTEGPARVRELISFGARFDRLGAELATTREGGHSVARVIHAGGDATGAEIQRALAQTTLDLDIEVRERWLVTDLLVEDGRAVGVPAL